LGLLGSYFIKGSSSAAMKGRVKRTEHFPIPFLAAEQMLLLLIDRCLRIRLAIPIHGEYLLSHLFY